MAFGTGLFGLPLVPGSASVPRTSLTELKVKDAVEAVVTGGRVWVLARSQTSASGYLLYQGRVGQNAVEPAIFPPRPLGFLRGTPSPAVLFQGASSLEVTTFQSGRVGGSTTTLPTNCLVSVPKSVVYGGSTWLLCQNSKVMALSRGRTRRAVEADGLVSELLVVRSGVWAIERSGASLRIVRLDRPRQRPITLPATSALVDSDAQRDTAIVLFTRQDGTEWIASVDLRSLRLRVKPLGASRLGPVFFSRGVLVGDQFWLADESNSTIVRFSTGGLRELGRIVLKPRGLASGPPAISLRLESDGESVVLVLQRVGSSTPVVLEVAPRSLPNEATLRY
jgi:hypothetical protein